jgi:hypothetical protein
MSTRSAEAGKVARALNIVLGNENPSTQEDIPVNDFALDPEPIPLQDFEAPFSNQCKQQY